MLDEEQRRQVYISLLRGLAQTAQDRLCASGQHHDWSEWKRTALEHDVPILPIADVAMMHDAVVRVKSERHCLNCGVSAVL